MERKLISEKIIGIRNEVIEQERVLREKVMQLPEDMKRFYFFTTNEDSDDVKLMRNCIRKNKIYKEDLLLEYEDTIELVRKSYHFEYLSELTLIQDDTTGFIFHKDDNTLDYLNVKNSDAITLFGELSDGIGMEWYYYMDDEIKELTSKDALAHIFTKEITSEEKFIKYYINNVLKYPLDYKMFRKFLLMDPEFYMDNKVNVINAIVRSVNNPNEFLRRLTDDNTDINSDYYKMFIDLLALAEPLGVHIGWNWSMSRLKEVHDEFVRAEMEKIMQSIDPLVIPNKGTLRLPEEAECTLIESNVQCFREAKQMRNCLYTNYYGKMLRREYWALSVTKPERATVGITFQNPYQSGEKKGSFVVEQMYGPMNSQLQDETKKIFNDWVVSPDVQEFFKVNSQEQEVKRTDASRYKKPELADIQTCVNLIEEKEQEAQAKKDERKARMLEGVRGI